ncbi:MAG: hypothetical protein WBD22_08120 [Pyrinomonadaceae bacterium]
MSELESLSGECVGDCSWAWFRRMDCMPGSGTCTGAKMLKAADSDFHPKELQDAAMAIQKVLDGITSQKDRKLSFLSTRFGVLLAWAEHNVVQPTDTPVTAASSDQEIIDALGLIDVPVQNPGQQSY